MYTFLIKTLRSLVTSNDEMYALVSNRVYPRKVDLAENPTYPLIVFGALTSQPLFAQGDTYVDDIILEFSCISEESFDQSLEIFTLLHGILNDATASDGDRSFVITKDSGAIDATGRYGDRLLYVTSSTWRVRTIG